MICKEDGKCVKMEEESEQGVYLIQEKGGGPATGHVHTHSCDPSSVTSKTKVHRSPPRDGFLQNRPRYYVTSLYVSLFSFPELLEDISNL